MSVSPENYWKIYIGSVTVGEFIGPFDGDVEAAIASLIENWSWVGGDIPEDFVDTIRQNCEDDLFGE